GPCQHPRLRQDRFQHLRLGSRAGERAEKELREIQLPDPALFTWLLCEQTGCLLVSTAFFAECGICDYQRPAPAPGRGLQPQEVAPARQIAELIPFDQVTVLLIHERGERDQVEYAFGRNQYPLCRAQQGADRL